MYRILTILVLFALAGCSYKENRGIGAIGKGEELAPVSMTSFTESGYSLYFSDKSYVLSILEPKEGCLLGSYVLGNRQLNFDMAEYDRIIEKPTALSMYNMKLGESFPYQWALECIKNKKTPYIVVHPPNRYVPFQESLIYSAAKDFAELYVPIFVDFYPNPQSITENPEDYTAFVKKAYEAFKAAATNTVFVLSVNSENIYDYGLYYPGEEYTDWIGLSLYEPRYINGTKNMRSYDRELDYFYTMYQFEGPLLISQLAVSNYSTYDHRYASKEAAERLEGLYSSVKTDYSRIKAINYMDFNNIENSPSMTAGDNFSVCQNERVLKAFKEVIGDEYFLSESSMEHSGEMSRELFKSNFKLFEDENYKYIPESSLKQMKLPLPKGEGVTINGEIYYANKDIDCVIDEDMKRVIVELAQ